jgi:CRISPR-associated protein Cas6
MPSVDLLFPVIGSRLPTDHAYPLYAALSRLVPGLHEQQLPLALAPITGVYAGNGEILLNPQSSVLRLRVAVEHIPQVLCIAGKRVRVLGRRLQIGPPRVRALTPSPSLISHAVTIKHSLDETSFLLAAERKLADILISARIELPHVLLGPRQGEPRRLVRRVKDDIVVCFGLVLHDLTTADSIRLQEVGLGGRRRMGCGIFLPLGEADSA